MTQTGISISKETRQLGRYMAAAPSHRLPSSVTEKAKHHILDTFSAMVSGSRLLSGRRAISYIETLGGVREAGVAGSQIVTTAANAAFANGICAHADETDDTNQLAYIHPGCATVPAALALAQREKASGEQFLRAVVLGYDVGCRLTKALDPIPFSRTERSPHSYGSTFAAGAAAGALLKLGEVESRHLLSYLAQYSGGCNSVMYDIEHNQKAFVHAGKPAQAGVMAATMVATGFTGTDDVFTGERNFLEAYSPSPQLEQLVDGLGERFEIMATTIKKWCVCSPIQAPLDSIQTLMGRDRLVAKNVADIEVRITPRSVRTVDNCRMPDMNLQHLVALMLVDGGLTFNSCHDDDRLKDPRVQSVRQRIRLLGDDSLPTRNVAWHAVVEVSTCDGHRLTEKTTAVRGTPANPMTRDEVVTKAHDLLDGIIGGQQAEKLIQMTLTIEEVGDMSQFQPLLADLPRSA